MKEEQGPPEWIDEKPGNSIRAMIRYWLFVRAQSFERRGAEEEKSSRTKGQTRETNGVREKAEVSFEDLILHGWDR